jgi:hypothetical protein
MARPSKKIGFADLPADHITEMVLLEVEIFGERVTVDAAADILCDPEGTALK